MLEEIINVSNNIMYLVQADPATGRPAIDNFAFSLTCQKNSDTEGLDIVSERVIDLRVIYVFQCFYSVFQFF